MKELDLVILNKTGLHARPAKEFVTLAKTFQSTIKVSNGTKTVNAKSLISVLALGVHAGGSISVTIDGEDETEAADALEAAVKAGLGEAHMLMDAPADGAPASEEQAAAPAPPIVEKTLASNEYAGIPAAPGIAIGPLFQLKSQQIVLNETFSSESDERARLQAAFDTAQEQLVTLRDEMLGRGQEEGKIFEVHLELMEDPELRDDVFGRIAGGKSAGFAWQATIKDRAEIIRNLPDKLLAERAVDLQDIGSRVLRILTGTDNSGETSLPDHPVIIIGADLTPSTTAQLDQTRVLGFCTALGGPTSHSAILARALGIPAVVSAGDAILSLDGSVDCILNGTTGVLTIQPNSDQLKAAEESRAATMARQEAANKAAAEPAVTKDGHRVEVVANIGNLKDAQNAYASGAEGVGLLRTEFLFLDREQPPTEEEQYQVYHDIVAAMHGQPVIFRTLDIGGDKPLPYIDMPHEDNPFLGVRGIRLCLARPEILETQLRAILRASRIGKIRIMFPMVADLSDWRGARDMAERIRKELNVDPVELGIMVEVPSTALMADAFAKEVDFFSVGTNDLTQYTMAMDRLNPALAGKADGLHPSVLRLIQRTVEAAHAHKKWVGVCGELGADPGAVPILTGIGVDELSVASPSVASVKAQVREYVMSDLRTFAQKVLTAADAAETRSMAAEYNKNVLT